MVTDKTDMTNTPKSDGKESNVVKDQKKKEQDHQDNDRAISTLEVHDDASDADTNDDQKQSTENKKRLKEPRVCRVFFSSPFRGMEAERELLTKQYFPTLQSLCNAQGVQFIPVDMRWGISHELSTNAKTVEVCLREIDRSDIFVGFFGQVRIVYLLVCFAWGPYLVNNK